jgi:hypothetical protein
MVETIKRLNVITHATLETIIFSLMMRLKN